MQQEESNILKNENRPPLQEEELETKLNVNNVAFKEKYGTKRNSSQPIEVEEVLSSYQREEHILIQKYEIKCIESATKLLRGLHTTNSTKWSLVPEIIKSLEKERLITSKEISIFKKPIFKKLNNYSCYIGHKIATAESLTSGLIMSTLVDIPWGGYLKYGGFMVYDTDAKRTFIGVTEDNVYTAKCAMQMAKGVLLNSNATIAIAVTGHAMPRKNEYKDIGKVVICIAGFNSADDIIYKTYDLASCTEANKDVSELCNIWYRIYGINSLLSSTYTTILSKLIRYITVNKAYELCLDFINKYNPSIPTKKHDLRKRILYNLSLDPSDIPKSKYFNFSQIKSINANTTFKIKNNSRSNTIKNRTLVNE